MEELKKSDYTPSIITKSQFEEVFNKYLDHLNNSHGRPGDARNPHSRQMSVVGEASAADEDMDENMDDSPSQDPAALQAA